MSKIVRKNPEDLSATEREKLRFYLTHSDLHKVFEQYSLPLGWLPFLINLNLNNSLDSISNWIISKVKTPNDISEILNQAMTRGKYFSEKLKNIMEYKFPEKRLLKKSWQILIHYFDDEISQLSRLKWEKLLEDMRERGISVQNIDRLVEFLRPRLVIYPNIDNSAKSQVFKDIFKVNYLGYSFVLIEEIMEIWKEKADSSNTRELLRKLDSCLNNSLQIAKLVGEEQKDRGGMIDNQIRFVADKSIDSERMGYFNIIRLMIELWEHLAELDANLAGDLVNKWKKSKYRTIRKLAIIGSANSIISTEIGYVLLTDLITKLELLGSFSRAEVIRLIETRWNNFSSEQKAGVEKRILSYSINGSSNLFGGNQFCFDILYDMEQHNLQLGKQSKEFLTNIKSANPGWESIQLKSTKISKNKGSQISIPLSIDMGDLNSVEQFIKSYISSESIDNKSNEQIWRDICVNYSSRALTGLKNGFDSGYIPLKKWFAFLQVVQPFQSKKTVKDIMNIISKFPDDIFDKLHFNISQWLYGSVSLISVDSKFWSLFNRVSKEPKYGLIVDYSKNYYVEEITTEHLADVLGFILTKSKNKKDLYESITMQNLKQLLKSKDESGHRFRVRLSTYLPILFKNYRNLVEEEILPHFNAQRPDVDDFWFSQIGNTGPYSHDLFRVLEKPFIQYMELKKNELDGILLEYFVKQLIWMEFTNQIFVKDYTISSITARNLLRKVGKKCLPIVATELCNILKSYPNENRPERWKKSIEPVFEKIWPLDIDVQTTSANDSLLELICLSDSAFKKTFSVIFPYMLKNDMQSVKGVNLLLSLSRDRVWSNPKEVLDLLSCVLGERPTFQQSELIELLNQIKEGDLRIANTKKFQRISKIVENIPNS